jgi:uncharacterized repeat protein (TIGR01451 family)
MHGSRHVTRLLVIALFLLAAASRMGARAVGVGPETSTPIARGQRQGRLGRVVLRADDRFSTLRVPRRHGPASLSAQTATITVEYIENETNDWGEWCGVWDASARAAFQYAADIWAEQIHSTVPIVVEACWTDLGPGILGSAGPDDFDHDFPGAPRSGTWYPIALANALAGYDLSSGVPDVSASLNSSFPSWYFGTDGNPPGSLYDLVSVVLHEICHGLGFIGSMWVNEYGLGSWGWGAYPIVFDHYLENGSGQNLLTEFENYSFALGNQLRGMGNGVYFDGPNATGANGGPVKLYAPFTWDGGSSIYHVDEIFGGTPDALMTYRLARGEATHDPGAVTRGILEDLGWALAPPRPDLAISKHVVGSPDLAPGDPVTYTLSIANAGAVTSTNVVITDIMPAEVLTTTWQRSPSLAALTLRGGTGYVWDLSTLAPGSSGVITIAGTISSPLPPDPVFWNRATIAGDEQEALYSNNTGMALVGGHRGYLVLVFKNSQ